MKTKYIVPIILLTCTGLNLSFAQVSNFTAVNPNNSGASVSLNWLNDIPRIRYGGNGPGSGSGFQIQGPGDITKFTITHAGQIGIGNTSPQQILHVEGIARFERLSGGANYVEIESNSNAAIIRSDDPGSNQKHFRFQVIPPGANDVNRHFYFDAGKVNGQMQTRLFINGNGRVGIGTTAPDSRLTVNGDIHAEEVRVDLNVPGPDYVFEEDYELMSLESIQQYIKQNKHLPEVPSAKEMEEQGLNLGDMNMLLLKKVEELTLHTIEQEKEINAIRSEFSAQVKALEEQLQLLIKSSKTED